MLIKLTCDQNLRSEYNNHHHYHHHLHHYGPYALPMGQIMMQEIDFSWNFASENTVICAGVAQSLQRLSYGLDAPGIESWWGTRFSSPVQTGPEAHPAFYTEGTGSFPGANRPGLGADHPPPSSAEVKKRVELYVYCPSGLSWPVLGWPLPLAYVTTM